MRKMTKNKTTKRNSIYGVLAFICSAVSAVFYCYGIEQAVESNYQIAWTYGFTMIPIIILMLTSLFMNEVKNTRKIALIISASLLALGAADSISENDLFFATTTQPIVDSVLDDILFYEFSSTFFPYAVVLVFIFILFCKPIWTKAFCLIQAGLYLAAILYSQIANYSFNVFAWNAYIGDILFYIGFFFLASTMTKDLFEEDEKELATLDFTYFFKNNAYLEMSYDTAVKSHMDYASFYEYIKKNDFDAIKEKGYFGYAFASQMIVDLYNLLEELAGENLGFEYILLKQKVDELYNVRDDVSAFELKFFVFLHFLSKPSGEELKSIAVDISSKSEFPINMLSNFANNPFVLDGVNIASMEGFLQSLKYKNVEKQKRICELTGKDAKNAGKHHNFWKITRTLYWNGKKINRYSKEYTQLITRAYDAMAENNPEFVKILLSTQYKVLLHSIGKDYKWQTVLTQDEFTEEQLLRLRIKYATEQKDE